MTLATKWFDASTSDQRLRSRRSSRLSQKGFDWTRGCEGGRRAALEIGPSTLSSQSASSSPFICRGRVEDVDCDLKLCKLATHFFLPAQLTSLRSKFQPTKDLSNPPPMQCPQRLKVRHPLNRIRIRLRQHKLILQHGKRIRQRNPRRRIQGKGTIARRRCRSGENQISRVRAPSSIAALSSWSLPVAVTVPSRSQPLELAHQIIPFAEQSGILIPQRPLLPQSCTSSRLAFLSDIFAYRLYRRTRRALGASSVALPRPSL